MWQFKRPSTCIKLHDSLNNLNKSHDYLVGSVIKVRTDSLLNCRAVSWKNFVKFWPYFVWEHIFIWINENKERMRRKVRYGISNLFFFGCGIKCHLHAVDHLQEISLDLAPESKFFIVWLLQYGNNPTVWFTGLWN